MSISEPRKILALGGSSVIALPKGWMKHHQLDDGDEVEVVIDESLIIRPRKKEQKNGDR